MLLRVSASTKMPKILLRKHLTPLNAAACKHNNKSTKVIILQISCKRINNKSTKSYRSSDIAPQQFSIVKAIALPSAWKRKKSGTTNMEDKSFYSFQVFLSQHDLKCSYPCLVICNYKNKNSSFFLPQKSSYTPSCTQCWAQVKQHNTYYVSASIKRNN